MLDGFLVVVALLVGLLWPKLAAAQGLQMPPDVVVRDGSVSIPAPPASFAMKRVGQVTWHYHPSATSLMRELSAQVPENWARLTAELGAQVSPALTIRIARGPSDMVALAPRGAPPPSYAVGVAYPALGLIILSVVEPNSWLPPDLRGVLTHELSHVALHRAVRGRPLPLWFVEGMAVQQAREQNLARIQTLWEASVAATLLPLSSLSENFPSTPHRVNLAYAQSADLVRFMLREEHHRESMVDVIRRVGEGESFDAAVLAAYRFNLPYLDSEWRRSLRERFHMTPLLLTGSAIWGGIAVLAAFAFVRRRRQQREKLARWAEEEALQERAAMALHAQRPSLDPGERPFRFTPAWVELGREPGVPTVVHEGQQHTLH